MKGLIAQLDIEEIVKITLTLFLVLDIIGTIPFIIKVKNSSGRINSLKTTLVVGAIGLAFILFGQRLLLFYEIELSSFRAAGGLVLFLLGVELVFDLEINKIKLEKSDTASITPLAFPVIAGTGTLTTLIILQEEYHLINIIIGFLLNLIFIYFILRYVEQIEKILGPLLVKLLSKLFGIILLTIGIQLIKKGFMAN